MAAGGRGGGKKRIDTLRRDTRALRHTDPTDNYIAVRLRTVSWPCRMNIEILRRGRARANHRPRRVEAIIGCLLVLFFFSFAVHAGLSWIHLDFRVARARISLRARVLAPIESR